MNAATGMTYAGSGVEYDALDPFKLMAQAAARKTAKNVRLPGVIPFEPSRGESAYLVRVGDRYLGHVEEGLGTKNLIADKMLKLTKTYYYNSVSQCTVAMAVNDLITVGVHPATVAMHLAVGTADWLKDRERNRDIINGWKRACDLAGAVWSGGETPALKGIVMPNTALFSGSATGFTLGLKRIDSSRVRSGDLIIICESSGIHANGATLCRAIGDKLRKGYLTEVPGTNGMSYGEALLQPTHIYADIVRDCIEAGISIHYAVNITGHGWRKLMRPKRDMTYVIDTMPTRQPLFDFICEQGPVDIREAYGTLNMGAGFALYIHPSNLKRFWKVFNSKHRHYRAYIAGWVEAGERRVVIDQLGVEYKAKELAVRV